MDLIWPQSTRFWYFLLVTYSFSLKNYIFWTKLYIWDFLEKSRLPPRHYICLDCGWDYGLLQKQWKLPFDTNIDTLKRKKKHSVTKNYSDLSLFEQIVLVISKILHILDLQPRILKVFCIVVQNNFWNKIPLCFHNRCASQ